MRYSILTLAVALTALALSPTQSHAQAFSDVTSRTFEREAITEVVERGWMSPQTPTLFGYGVAIKPEEWLYMLMFLRTSDACPELGPTPNAYWTTNNIQACLAGAGVPVGTEQPHQIRRDEAMQQLFALRQRSFAFQGLETKPAGFIDPADLAATPVKRQGAILAADRLKLLFRTQNKLFPASPLLREDAALSISRFVDWEKQGGTDKETNDQQVLSKEARLNHWRDLDTDIYVIQAKLGGDTLVRPIVPRRSFNPAKDPVKEKLRDEFVYQPVSSLAKESGALAAINGSYFNVNWPWGAFEDASMVNGKLVLERTDRSTFIVCKDGKTFIGKYDKKELNRIKCAPEHMLGAGPLFLSQGQVLTQSTKESFDEYTQWERRVGSNARTAVGISADRKTVYLIVVAGKSYPAFGRGGSSLGAFLKEKYPDLNDAMMYDGGGSSALYAKGSLLVGMGVSGGKAERPVISALGIFSKKADQLAAQQLKKDQAKYWDKSTTAIRIEKPSEPLPWQTLKEAREDGTDITLSGSRGSAIQVPILKNRTATFSHTFDHVIHDKTSNLTLTRREGRHEKGWNIPTEIHILDGKNGSDTDVIQLFAYLPETQKPDLKTFDAIAFRPTGVVFGDDTGRYWFYYAKDKQLSPGKFKEPAKPKAPATKVKK